MSDLFHKDFDAEIELKMDDSGEFKAYVARFNNVDRVNELIEPGAFKNLDEFMTDGWMGVSHDMHALPVAMIDSAKQDEKGLLVSGRFHSHAAAQATRSVIKERMDRGRSVKCSIGYRVDESKPDKLNGKSITRLKALRIFEASFVNLPANPAATVIDAKSLNQDGPKLITVDGLKAYLESFDVKAGRSVSQANINKLKEMHAKLGDAHATLGSFIDQHDPTASDPETANDLMDGPMVGGGGRVVDKAARLQSLRLCALQSRALMASLPRE